MLFQQLCQLEIQAWNFIWANPQNLTPQEACALVQAIVAALPAPRTSTCAAVFALHAATVAYLNAQVAGSVPIPYNALPNGVTYTVNSDGSLTLAGV